MLGAPPWVPTIGDLAKRLREAFTENKRLKAATPSDLRAKGWTVAIHNDYRYDGIPYTFWLLTRVEGLLGEGPRGAHGRFLKGEGRDDVEALDQIRAALAKMERGD